MNLDVETRRLTRFRRRVAGSDAERRAALYLRDRLEDAGRPAEIEPFRFRNRWALAQAAAAGLAVIGSVLSVSRPALGTAVVAFAAASSMLEAAGVASVLSRLTGTRASQNVSSPPDGKRAGLLVLVAGYDAPRESAFARAAGRVGNPWRVLGGAFVALLACCALRPLGVEGDTLTAVQLLPTLLLLAALPLLVDVELAPVGAGAAEAAGVEVAVELAGRLAEQLEQLDVWLVLAGAQGAERAGVRAWRRRHRADLTARPSVTIEVGAPLPEHAGEVADGFLEIARSLDARAGGEAR